MLDKNKIKKGVPVETSERGYKVLAVNWQSWLNILLLFITLELAVLSIEKAHWLSPQPSLTLTLILAVLVTLLLARTSLSGWIIHPLVIIIGLPVTLWQAQNLVQGQGFFSRIEQVLGAISTAGAEKLLFGVFLVAVTWFFGYLSAWFLLRRQNPWVGVALGALVIMINLSNLTDSYYYFLFLFFIAAPLFIAHTRMLKRPDPAGYSRRGWIISAVALLCVAVLAGGFARIIPELRIPQLQTFIATQTLWKENVERSRVNLFNAIPSKQAINASGAHREQPFPEGWHAQDDINFIVQSARPSYWRVHAYDLYTASGWSNSPSGDFLLGMGMRWTDNAPAASRVALTYTVKTNLKTDIMLLAGRFLSSDNPSLVQFNAGEVISARLPRILASGERYSVTSGFSSPSPADLSGAGTNYPQFIYDTYLQLPEGFSRKVTDLSKSLTAGAATPYDKVLAINKYLVQIPYSDKIKAPSQGVDPVENFLFTQKSGFCLYYASAMAVMLRSVDVPTRMAVGYLPGDPGEEAGEYLLRDNHYHAWPQVYFDGFGWVDMETTPGGEGSGVAIESPWITGEAIEEFPEWDVWLSNALELPELPETGNEAGKTAAASDGYGAFFFADELALAIVILMIAAVILIVLATPVLAARASFLRWLWHVDRDTLAFVAYDRMCNLAARVEMGPHPQQTPLEFTAGLAEAFPEQAGAFYHVTSRYVEKKFGRRDSRLGLFEEAELLKARCIAFGALLKRLGLAGVFKHVRRK